jgi:homoserine kinase
MRDVAVTIPSSIFNIAGGYGFLGISLDLYHDIIKLYHHDSEEDEVYIGGKFGEEAIEYKIHDIIYDVLYRFKEKHKISSNFRVIIDKDIPLYNGLCGELTAILGTIFSLSLACEVESSDQEILNLALQYTEYKYIYWSGLAASYYGGIIIIDPYLAPITIMEADPPEWLDIIFLEPTYRWDPETHNNIIKRLPKSISLTQSLLNTASLMLILEGLINEDSGLIKKGLQKWGLEKIIERNIAHYNEIKELLSEYDILGMAPSNIGPGIAIFIDDRIIDIDNIYKDIRRMIERNSFPYIPRLTTISIGIEEINVTT